MNARCDRCTQQFSRIFCRINQVANIAANVVAHGVNPHVHAMCSYDIIPRVWKRHFLFEVDEVEIYACIESCVYLFFYINRIQDTRTNYKSQIQTSTMAKKRSSKSKKGGWGGWERTTHVGPAWNGGGNGGNHFALSRSGVPSGNPIPVPAFWGPGMHQANRLVPHLSPKALSMGGGGSKRTRRTNNKHNNRSRSKRGGFVFGGFPQDLKIGWDNLKIGVQNVYRGFMGTNQLNSASPWNQPALRDNVQPPVKTVDITAIRNAAQARVAKIH